MKCVWNEKMGEYLDLYLNTVVLLEADVFEEFRYKCLEYYRLDSCLYFSTPILNFPT